VAGQWFFPVSSTNKTDRHDINEKILKVVLNIITPNSPALRLGQVLLKTLKLEYRIIYAFEFNFL
jgi:hypothetical protein